MTEKEKVVEFINEMYEEVKEITFKKLDAEGRLYLNDAELNKIAQKYGFYAVPVEICMAAYKEYCAKES